MDKIRLTKEQYISVLENEKEVLQRFYYKGDQGLPDTGHFNTAIGVLQFRIEELKNQVC
jgi:hypothetical protein